MKWLPRSTGQCKVAKANEQYEEAPDEFLPLHHEAVRRATGVSAATLKKAILSHRGQFAPGAVLVLNVGNRRLLRFNPARHLDRLEGTTEWQDEPADGRYTGGEKLPGSGGPMGKEERCASESSTRQAANLLTFTPSVDTAERDLPMHGGSNP
jgi:hypothetical protein